RCGEQLESAGEIHRLRQPEPRAGQGRRAGRIRRDQITPPVRSVRLQADRRGPAEAGHYVRPPLNPRAPPNVLYGQVRYAMDNSRITIRFPDATPDQGNVYAENLRTALMESLDTGDRIERVRSNPESQDFGTTL